MKIALDAMGGDNAPEVNIVGARDALALYPSIEILYLVGDKDILTKECAKHKLTDPRIEIVHATQVVAMHESGATTLRTKRDSSISVATGLVKSGDADAVVSAGNTGAAVLVFPGGGYTKVAVELEGSEICEWLASIGVTGILLKYRVPDSGPHYYKDCHCEKDPVKPLALQDAQRAIGMVRAQAKQWNINPDKIGVMGFSAGGHLVADVSTNYRKRAYQLTDDFDKTNCRPNFGIVMFPGHMTNHTSKPYELNNKIPVDSNTPPTFILQAGNDPVDPIENSLVYYMALQKAKVHAEYHVYAEGGHAFGLNRTILDNPNWNKLPIADWENLIEKWLKTIKMTTN